MSIDPLTLDIGVACVTPSNLPTTAALITIGSWALGYTDSVGLAMCGIAIDDQNDIGTAVGLAGCIRNTISTIGTAVYSVCYVPLHHLFNGSMLDS